jgi:hypothetical protein
MRDTTQTGRVAVGFVGTSRLEIQVDLGLLVQVGYRLLTQIGTGLQWYISN